METILWWFRIGWVQLEGCTQKRGTWSKLGYRECVTYNRWLKPSTGETRLERAYSEWEEKKFYG